MMHVVVVRAFGPYRVGDVVNDAEAIERILASEHAGHVVRINPPEEI